ncbi:SGNH/GDSL hydrolase family protein [Rhodococcus sp. NPDC127530]|uniref:SGNH/GDSL hydrolase family protein n=1 Tax=unclassified Rhodococcus (in: high G+C Gram-positive bacteria) TaxID=192944 RepID=UPI003645659D
MVKNRLSESNLKVHSRVVVITSLLLAAAIGFGVIAATRQSASTAGADAPVTHSNSNHVRLRVSFVGDSYTKGVGASAETGYASLLTNQYCWSVQINGQAGTGYVNKGREPNQEFSRRIPSVASTSPNLIIVQGSTSDSAMPNVEAAATETLVALKAAAPGAVVVAVGPTDPPAVNDARAASTRDSVQSASIAAGARFVDPIALHWLSDPALYATDGLHPNPAGHAEYARLLAQQLEALGLPNLDSCQAG